MTREMKCAVRSRAQILLAFVMLVGCNKAGDSGLEPAAAQSSTVSSPAGATAPCAIALAPHSGNDRVDLEIIELQQKARVSATTMPSLERLGWAYIAKARLSFDAGFYKLAEQTALCLESKKPGSPESLLLRGHVLHNLHRFKEAEALARDLVARRGLSFDNGLLGDALMEQGRLTEAVVAYQDMMDQKPGPQAYSRAAHVRWLKGDLTGAIELMRIVAGASDAREPDSAAWAFTRLALYQLQAGATPQAMQLTEAALASHKDYAPALLVRGRILLAENQIAPAVDACRRAAAINPLPEYQWALWEALRAAGRLDEARSVEAVLVERGAASDPRTLALYLATRREHVETAVGLAQAELAVRADVFTRDALAWALMAAGDAQAAQTHVDKALAEGTQDARLFLHAGVIAERLGHTADALRWFGKARVIQQMLLPSEREQLRTRLAALEQAQTMVGNL